MDIQPQSGDAQINCPNCQSSNRNGQYFCGNCGNTLTSSVPETIDSIVKRELDSRLKDQKVVAVEIAESVYDRVSKWAKIFVVLFTLPLGAAVYFIYGQYVSLSDLVKTSRTEAERILAGANARAHSVDTATKKAQGLNVLLERQGESLTSLESKIIISQGKLNDYEKTIQNYEARLSRSGTEALSQVASLKQNGDTALKEISQLREKVNQQQKELTETGALLQQLASRSLLEGFKASELQLLGRAQ